METQIFYWTGVVVWWAVCGTAVVSVVTASVIAPLLVYKKVKSNWWRWLTLAKFADTGWSAKELRTIVNRANIDDVKFYDKAKVVLAEGRKMKNKKN